MLCGLIPCHRGIDNFSDVAKPRHTRARAQATFACALAFACRSFKLVPRAKEIFLRAEYQQERSLNTGDVYYFRYTYLA